MAAANVILQAGARVRARQVHRAGRNAKRFVNEMHDAVRQAVREKGAKVDRTVFDQPARDINTRIFFKRGVADVGIRFIVAQQDVEFRLVLLDEVVFQRQGFALIVHHDVVEVRDFSDQRAGLCVHPARFQEIRAHTVAQGTRFPDIQNFSQRILEQVHPRLHGKAGGFLYEFHRGSRMRAAAFRSRATSMIAK